MNIEQIDWKIFLRHMPTNLQLDTINHLLIAMAYGSCEFLVHKVSLHLPNYYPIQIGTHGSLESLNLYKMCKLSVHTHDQTTGYRSYTYIKYIQVTLLQNLIAWGTLHTAIRQR